MEGKGFTMTGHVGQVMQESMQAALTWVRSNAADRHRRKTSSPDDSHIHVPRERFPRWTFGGRDHGDGPGVVALGPSLPAGSRDDRRNHAQRPRASNRRH